VVLAVVTLALRRDLERRGAELEELRAFVPVSVREESQRGALGNQVSGLVVDLPVACSDPVRCLESIQEATGEVKSSGQAVGAQALTELAGFAPPTLLAQGSRLAPFQRFVNLVVTNVPGPPQPLHLGGSELLDILPMVPVGKNLALNVAVVSYNGRMYFGITADFHALPEAELLADDIEEALFELAAAAGLRPPGLEPEEPSAPPAEAPSEPPRPRADAEPAPPSEPEAELVAESAEAGAEQGAGPEVSVAEPWPGYDAMSARDVIERLEGASEEAAAVVRMYEASHRDRPSVIEATERAIAR